MTPDTVDGTEKAVSVAGVVLEGGLIFVARRKPGGSLSEKWELPGGKAEPGESDGEALIREFREEFGVEALPGEFLGEARFSHGGVERELHAWTVALQGEKELREHSEWKFASLDEMEAMDFAGSDRKLFPALRAYLLRVSG